jgi:hypothetical protein
VPASDHIGHRVVLTRYPDDRATLRCDDCACHISTGSTIPHDKPAHHEWPQVVTGLIEDDSTIGLFVRPEEVTRLGLA